MMRFLNRLHLYSSCNPVITRHALASLNGAHLVVNSVIEPSVRRHLCSTSVLSQKKKMISVTFINRDGVPLSVKAKVGDTLLDAAVNNDVDLEGFGACEGTLSCSTCHLIFKKEDYDKLPDKPSDEELDMLDLAYGLTDTSRLGCQITLDENMEGLVVTVPAQVADARNN